MKKEYIEHYSKCLNKQMHLCIYGHAGVTVLGFPTQDSNCHNYEDFGIIYHLSDFIEQGRIQIVTVDSVDEESWSKLPPSEAEAFRNTYLNNPILTGKDRDSSK